MPPSYGRIALAAGGTGGHIYPALEVARALRAARPALALDFYCGCRPVELEIYKSAGIQPVVLPVSGRRPGMAATLRFASEMFQSYRAARERLRASPVDLALGFGNYSSVPVLMAARRAGAATALHEQNAKPGLANRWLARGAAAVFTGLPAAPGSFGGARVIHAGNPVRAELFAPGDRAAARRFFGLPEAGLVCLAFGGSQGARGVNRLMAELVRAPGEASGWSFLWAAGRDAYDAAKAALEEAGSPPPAGVRLVPYIDRMDLAYAAADLIICRAGALTLAELAAAGKPALLVPLPTSAGGHQAENARRVEAAGAAQVIEECDAAAADKIRTSLRIFSGSCDTLIGMGRAARTLAAPDAAEKMAQAILELIERNSERAAQARRAK